MNQKEKIFCEFMFEDNDGKRDQSIYYKIIHTPDSLLVEIEREYPEECNIFYRYSHENNYWNDLKQEYEINCMLTE